MSFRQLWRPSAMVLVGAVAGSLVIPPVVSAATRASSPAATLPGSQVVLAQGVCFRGVQHCTIIIAVCGIIGGIVIDGATGPAVLTTASGPNLWYDQTLTSTGHLNEMFVPGLLFQEDLTFGLFVGGGTARYFVYGNHMTC